MMNIKKSIKLIKRSVLKRFLSLFSLSAVAFTFQACYGTGPDFETDVQISGKVVSADTGKPIPDILVSLDNYFSECKTDASGYYTVFVPADTLYLLEFEDVDGDLNGSYVQAQLPVKNLYGENELKADIALSKEN